MFCSFILANFLIFFIENFLQEPIDRLSVRYYRLILILVLAYVFTNMDCSVFEEGLSCRKSGLVTYNNLITVFLYV